MQNFLQIESLIELFNHCFLLSELFIPVEYSGQFQFDEPIPICLTHVGAIKSCSIDNKCISSQDTTLNIYHFPFTVFI